MGPVNCSSCAHFTPYRDSTVGSCALGGPDPSQGSSDVGEHESCEKHKRAADDNHPQPHTDAEWW